MGREFSVGDVMLLSPGQEKAPLGMSRMSQILAVTAIFVVILCPSRAYACASGLSNLSFRERVIISLVSFGYLLSPFVALGYYFILKWKTPEPYYTQTHKRLSRLVTMPILFALGCYPFYEHVKNLSFILILSAPLFYLGAFVHLCYWFLQRASMSPKSLKSTSS